MKITITIDEAGSQASSTHHVSQEGRGVPAEALPSPMTSAAYASSSGDFSTAGARDGGPAPSGASALPPMAGPVPFMAAGADDFGMGRATPDLEAGGAPGAAQRVEAIEVPQAEETSRNEERS
jgi:hypothetical protein